MISETAKTWLMSEWGKFNPIFIDVQTAWDVLLEANSGNKNANEVWKEYASHKRLPDDVKEALKSIQTFDNLVSKVYVDRLRW